MLRQNGEVKYISVSPRVQCSVSILSLSLVVWFGYSNYKNLNLSEQIDVAQVKISQSQSEMNELSVAYQQKHATIQQQLKEVQNQQELLQNLVESLPDSITPDSDSGMAQSSEDTRQTEEATADSASTSSQSLEQSIFAGMDETEVQLNNLKTAQLSSFDQIYAQLDSRYNHLNSALAAAGFTQDNILAHSSFDRSAQGGPLFEVIEGNSFDSQDKLVTKLLDVIELENAMTNLPVMFPAKDYYISSGFGIRRDPIKNRPAMHKGIDMAGWRNTKIFAPAEGIVKRAGRNGSYGRFIEIDHQNGFSTRYGHLNKLKVKKGQKVTKGDVIGLMGNTGRSTSTHLHYEVLFNNKQINPLKFIKVLKDVL